MYDSEIHDIPDSQISFFVFLRGCVRVEMARGSSFASRQCSQRRFWTADLEWQPKTADLVAEFVGKARHCKFIEKHPKIMVHPSPKSDFFLHQKVLRSKKAQREPCLRKCFAIPAPSDLSAKPKN